MEDVSSSCFSTVTDGAVVVFEGVLGATAGVLVVVAAVVAATGGAAGAGAA